MDDQKCLFIAISAAFDAAREIMEVYQTVPKVELKADRSPLTEADKRAHEAIKKQLAATPFPLLSEEGRAIPYEERKNWNSFWLVDPLDGTKEFILKNGEFTVNIALVRKGIPELGVVYAPAKNLFYFALERLGSFKLQDPGNAYAGSRDVESLVKRSDRLPVFDSGRPYTVVGSRSHLSDATQRFVEGLQLIHGEVVFLSSGSSLKLCLVAEGKADVYPRLAPTMEWDTAAGHAVARLAGKPVKAYETGEELTYNKEDLLNPWFVVG